LASSLSVIWDHRADGVPELGAMVHDPQVAEFMRHHIVYD